MGYPLQHSWASLVTQTVRDLPAMQETWVWSLGWEDCPGGGHGNLFLPEEFLGQRSLTDCSPWGRVHDCVTNTFTQASLVAQM